MDSETRKALNFDFNTHFITDNMSRMEISRAYRKAYYAIGQYLSNNGYNRRAKINKI